MTGPVNDAAVLSWGAVGPLGLDAARLARLLRAGRNRFRVVPMVDNFGQRVTMSLVPGLNHERRGIERTIWMGRRALIECLQSLPAGRQGRREVRLALALPEHYGPTEGGRNAPPTAARHLASALIETLSSEGYSASVAGFPFGRAAGAYALQEASRWLATDKDLIAIVGGVDSYLDADGMDPLMVADRVFGPDQPDGSIPGEGAAFIGLGRVGVPLGRFLVRVTGTGTAEESSPSTEGEPSTAKGLLGAVKAATSSLRFQKRRAGHWVSDMTNDPYRLDELKRCFARWGDVMKEGLHWEAPCRELGDTGATTLPLMCVLACEGWAGGWAPDPVAVCFAGSDGPHRGAVLLEASPWA